VAAENPPGSDQHQRYLDSLPPHHHQIFWCLVVVGLIAVLAAGVVVAVSQHSRRIEPAPWRHAVARHTN
jgi:hypothetical protein